MGVHHAWGRTFKDLFQRYHTMLGERQRYQNGFDCQGLWIEVEVERQLGFNNKRQIEEFGIGRFVELCKERVAKFADRTVVLEKGPYPPPYRISAVGDVDVFYGVDSIDTFTDRDGYACVSQRVVELEQARATVGRLTAVPPPASRVTVVEPDEPRSVAGITFRASLVVVGVALAAFLLKPHAPR